MTSSLLPLITKISARQECTVQLVDSQATVMILVRANLPQIQLFVPQQLSDLTLWVNL